MGEAEEKNDKQPQQEESVPTASFGGSALGPGGQVGPYKLLSILGEGGFAIVYLAEQQRPVKRRVALKLIKPGMDTKQVIARFEAERQALALLDHPNIAQVYDAGTTEAGQPYFVMEHIKGVSITQHCDEQKLSIEERLGLFLQVCDAVQHAHQKGIIHRDIKPSNILVLIEGKKAIPKIIDFGVAKALTQPLTERTLFTEQGQLIGTPEYMSPEQAAATAQDIDTRSDIYSLGVVLYELLAGTLPFDRKTLEQAGFAEIQRIIREEDPPHPSTKLSSLGEEAEKVARSRRTEAATLAKRLREELEWIPLKAMEKDRTRRYETANALAQDILRHLHHEPILARPPSKIYRLRKFLRKHRAQVIAAACTLFFGLLGLSATWMYVRSELRREAESEFYKGKLALMKMFYAERGYEDAKTELTTPRKPEELFAHKSLQQYLVETFRSDISKEAWRRTYSEIATTIESERRGTWVIGKDLTKDGRPYRIDVLQGRWYARAITLKEARELGVSGEVIKRDLYGLMRFPIRKLVTLEKAELTIMVGANGERILTGRIYCANKSPQWVEHLTLVYSYPVSVKRNATGTLYQHIDSNTVPFGWLDVSIPLKQNVNLEYGGRFVLEAYLSQPRAGFFQISNELVITADSVGLAKP